MPNPPVDILVGGGIGSINPFSPLPPDCQPDDVFIMPLESTETLTLSPDNGFAAIVGGTAALGATVTCATFIARTAGYLQLAATTNDPANHGYGVVVRIRGLDPSLSLAGLINAIATSTKTGPDTSASAPSVDTTADNCLILNIIARDDDAAGPGFAAWSNANLTAGVEIHDDGTTSGNGGGIGIFAGTMVTRGTVGATTATCNSSANASVTIALNVPDYRIAWTRS